MPRPGTERAGVGGKRAALPVRAATSRAVADSGGLDTMGVVGAPWCTTPTGADGAVAERTGSAGTKRVGPATMGPSIPPHGSTAGSPLVSGSVVVDATRTHLSGGRRDGAGGASGRPPSVMPWIAAVAPSVAMTTVRIGPVAGSSTAALGVPRRADQGDEGTAGAEADDHAE